MKYPRFHEAAHAIASCRRVKDSSRRGRYHNARFGTIAQEIGLEGDRDREIGWSLTALSEATAASYADTLAQLENAVRGRPGPDDRAAAAAARGPVCGCGPWVAMRRRRRETIVAGTVMCEACTGQNATRD